MTVTEDDFGRCESRGHLVPEDELISLEIGGEEFLMCQPCIDDSDLVILK